ncbi:MAG: hypothetical protein AAFS10_13555 [Myxococcota bacterium]
MSFVRPLNTPRWSREVWTLTTATLLLLLGWGGPALAQEESDAWKEWSVARTYWEQDRDEVEQERDRNTTLREEDGSTEAQLYQSDGAGLTPPPPIPVATTSGSPSDPPTGASPQPSSKAEPEQARLDRIEEARQAAIARKQQDFDERRAIARARLERKLLEQKLLEEETNDQGQVVDDELKDLIQEVEE